MDIMNCFICVFMSFGFFMMLVGMIARGDSNYIVNTVATIITASNAILTCHFYFAFYENYELRYLTSFILMVIILCLTIDWWLLESETGKKVSEFLSRYKIFQFIFKSEKPNENK